MIGIVILRVHFGRSLFCNSSFNFFYIDDKEETNLIFFIWVFFTDIHDSQDGKGKGSLLYTVYKQHRRLTKI